MRILGPLLLIFFAACTREQPSGQRAVPASASSALSDYEQKLVATKATYPFQRGSWRAGARFERIFDTLISELVTAGEGAPEDKKIACFQRAVVALNDLNRSDLTLIGTSEAEQLCGLGNVVAMAAGLNPQKYGDGEGPISAGRDW